LDSGKNLRLTRRNGSVQEPCFSENHKEAGTPPHTRCGNVVQAELKSLTGVR